MIQMMAASIAAPAPTRTAVGAPPSKSVNQLPGRLIPATAFAPQGTARRLSQAAKGAPSQGWARSQASSRGELRAKAHVAIKRKGVVGSTGSTTPANARPTATAPRRRKGRVPSRADSDGE